MESPLPCPFCSSPDVHVNGIGQQVVRCMACRCEGPAVCAADPAVRARIERTSPAETPLQMLRRLAVEAWNAAPRRTVHMTTADCAGCGRELAVEECCACAEAAA